MSHLLIYGASDDCIEFSGAVNEEFYVGDNNTFLVSVYQDYKASQFEVTVEYKREWEIAVRALTGHTDFPVHVIFGQRHDYEDDPAVAIQIPNDAVVTVSRL